MNREKNPHDWETKGQGTGQNQGTNKGTKEVNTFIWRDPDEGMRSRREDSHGRTGEGKGVIGQVKKHLADGENEH